MRISRDRVEWTRQILRSRADGAWNEFIPLKETIPMVFSPLRQPQLCRGNLVVMVNWLIVLMVVISWNKYQIWI